MPRDPQDVAEEQRDHEVGIGLPRDESDRLADQAERRWLQQVYGKGA